MTKIIQIQELNEKKVLELEKKVRELQSLSDVETEELEKLRDEPHEIIFQYFCDAKDASNVDSLDPFNFVKYLVYSFLNAESIPDYCRAVMYNLSRNRSNSGESFAKYSQNSEESANSIEILSKLSNSCMQTTSPLKIIQEYIIEPILLINKNSKIGDIHVLLVDSLDEAKFKKPDKTTETIVDLFKKLSHELKKLPCFRFIATARPNESPQLRDLQFTNIPIIREDGRNRNKEDLRKYIKYRVDKIDEVIKESKSSKPLCSKEVRASETQLLSQLFSFPFHTIFLGLHIVIPLLLLDE